MPPGTEGVIQWSSEEDVKEEEAEGEEEEASFLRAVGSRKTLMFHRSCDV